MTFKTLKPQDRYKTVVIPVINGEYVVVEDRTYNELTFVVGGCKLKEIGGKPLPKAVFDKDYKSFKTCALRELKEETRGALGNIRPEQLKHGFKFSSRDRSTSELKKDEKEGWVVTMRYTAYYLYLDIPTTKFSTIQRRFKNAPVKRKEDMETQRILLVSKDELANDKKGKLWRFMKENVLCKLK